MVLGRNSVKGFHLKTMQTSISAFQNEDVLQPSLQKLCGCWTGNLTNSSWWDLSLKSSHLILYGSTAKSVGCTKINIKDF